MLPKFYRLYERPVAKPSHPAPRPADIVAPRTERTASSKPRVVGMKRRKDFAWPASTSTAIWKSLVMAMVALVAMGLPYYGAKRMMQPLRTDVANGVTANGVENRADSTRGSFTTGDDSGTSEVVKAAEESPSAKAIRVEALASDSRRAAGSVYGRREGDVDADLAQLGPRLSLARELGLGVRRIAIDAGHGGSDTGTTGRNGLMEKDLCLDVALRLGRLIEASMPGVQVIHTRTDDRFVALEERSAMANEAKADLFISIHANSSESREIRGVETYYVSLAGSREEGEIATRENASASYSLHNLPELVRKITRNENLSESRQLATDIQKALSQRLQLVNRGEKNRGVKRAPFVVLTGTNMPSVLSEISFVSNPSDEKLLLDSEQRQRITEGLYRGIVTYLERVPSGVSARATPGADARRMGGITASLGEGGRSSLDGLSGHGTRP